MARGGPWRKASAPGYQNPEVGGIYMHQGGMDTNRPLGMVNPDIIDMWGAGAGRNYLPAWQTKEPNGEWTYIDPESQKKFKNWNDLRHWYATGSGRRGRNNLIGHDSISGGFNRSRPIVPGGAGGTIPGSTIPPPPAGGQPGGSLGSNLGGGQPGGATIPDTLPPGGAGTLPGPLPGAGLGTPGGVSGGGENPANFGEPMFPWLMPYGGEFTAPMSEFENQGLFGYSDWVGGGQGLDSSRNYLEDVLGGEYLDFERNPWLQQIQSSGQTLKAYNDQDALRRIASGMAAGGNALSGARMGAESDYMGRSNAQFESMMANLMNQNYGMERGFQQGAPGIMAGLSDMQGRGYQNLFNMGSVPRELQQHDLDRGYGDWLRQVGGMEGAYRYPDQLMMSMLQGGGYRGQYPREYGNSIMDIIGGQAGANDWGGLIGDFLGGLVSGGEGSADIQTDGIQLGNDGSTPPKGPKGYWDTNYYDTALTAAQGAETKRVNEARPNTTAPAIIALLMNLLAGGNKGSKGGKGSSGGGGGLANSAGKAANDLLRNLFGSKTPSGSYDPNSPYSNPYGNRTNDPGSRMYDEPIGPTWQPPEQTPFIGPDDYYGPYMPEGGLSDIPFSGSDFSDFGGGFNSDIFGDSYGGDLTVPDATWEP